MSQSIGAPAPVLAVVDGIPTTTSLDVARQFGKLHDEVLRRIRNQITQLPADFTDRNFAVSEYTDPTGRTLPAYRLTRDGFTLLAMGFTGKKALAFKLAYIDAFNRMEAELRGKIDIPALGHTHPQQRTAQQCEAALQAGGVASLQVQMALPRAVLNGGDEWRHQRWLVSFVADSQIGTPPVVERLAADTLVLNKSEVITLAGNIAGDVWKEMRCRLDARKVGV